MTRALKWVLIVVAFFAAVLLVLDVVAKVAVERISARELRNADGINASAVDTSVDSFPFLGRLLVSGETSFSIGLDDVQDQGVRIDRIEFDVDGLVFDRDEALDQRVRINSVDRVQATVIIDEASISEALGVAVEVEPGAVSAAGVTVSVTVVDRTVTASAAGLGSASFAVPSSDWLPCAPSLELAPDRVELSCTTDVLPPLVNQALGRATP